MKKGNYIIFAFIFVVLIGFFLRFYKLADVPFGLQQDETSIGYNALSILHTGKDEYGEFLPLYFKAFGEYKLPVSIYATTASFALFGVSEFSLRLPSAFFGVLTVVVIYFLSWEIFKNRKIALVSMGFLALNPWHLHFSRGAFEVTPALFFITLGVYLYVRFLKNNSSLFLFFGILSLVVSMFAYNTSRLFVPYLIIVLGILTFKKIKTMSMQNYALLTFTLIVFFVAFILPFTTAGGFESTQGTLIPTSAPVQASNLELRSYIFEQNPLLSKIVFNKFFLDGVYYAKNIISYLDVNFYFLKGSLHGNHGIGNVGQFYIFELLTIIFGIIALLKNKQWRLPLLLWIGGVVAVASLTREAPHATRSFYNVVPLVLISAIGFYEIIVLVHKKIKKYNWIILGGVGLVGLYCVAFYLISYYYKFPIEYAKNFRSEDKKLVEELDLLYDKYDVIYIDSELDLLYSSILFYTKFSPQEFHSSVRRMQDDSEGFSKVVSFGKFEYVSEQSLNPVTNSLFITKRNKEGFSEIKSFSYPARPVVIAKGQEILQFPVEDLAYVLLEKN